LDKKEEFFPPTRAYNEDICPFMHELGRSNAIIIREKGMKSEKC
jgi:hypothetical protein